MAENTRNTRENTSKATELSFGLPNVNDKDPSGAFPFTKYWNSSNINYASTGGTYNSLSIGGSYENLPLSIGDPVDAEYPYNQVQETISGHVIEVNDTAGGERILIKHASGAGVDVRPDGSVVVVSTGKKVEISGEDQTVIIEGNADLTYKGDLNIKVTGDLNYDVAGNINVKARNRNENILGSDRKTINGNVSQIIRGGYSTTVTQQVTDTFLAGHSHNVKGTFSNNVNGDANYISSGTATFTSEGSAVLSASDLDIRGSNLDIYGGAGVIGGTSIKFSGLGAVFEQGVTAPTFHGDLDGNAANTYAQSYDEASTSGGGSITNTATPPITKPTVASVTEDLKKPTTGLRKVLIDVGSFLKNFIDKSSAYDGIDTVAHNTGQVRSRLKDPANRNNSKYVGTVISEGAMSTEYFKPVPTHIGRVTSGNSSPKFGQAKIGQVVGSSSTDPFLPRRSVATSILPDPLYNPLLKTSIASNTKLAPGITIGRFFGSTGDPTNIDFIKDQATRKSIAKHLYLHANVLRSIQLDKGTFRNLRLDVAEGVYRPGPKETLTANSVNDLKTKGRAIVYELFDDQGDIALSETFDLAEYWKDTLNFDKMILSYDTIDPAGKLRAQIILIMPEVSDNWTAKFNRLVETHFNNNVQTEGELVEIQL